MFFVYWLLAALQDHNQLEQLERQLSGQLAKQSGDAADALAMIQTIQQQQLELKTMHEDHLHTAAGFPTKQVAQALAVSLLCCDYEEPPSSAPCCCVERSAFHFVGHNGFAVAII